MKTRLVTVAAAFALIYGLPAMAQSRTQMLKAISRSRPAESRRWLIRGKETRWRNHAAALVVNAKSPLSI